VISSTYSYRAVRADGSLELGVLDAASDSAASALLADRGLFPVDVALHAAPEERRSRIPAADLALGLGVLGDLLDAGLSVGRALQSLDDLAPASWRPALGPVRESVREGRTLASALAAAPLEIPALVIGIVQAGEGGSGLAGAVRRAATIMEEQAATRAAVRAALVYPAILAVAGLASISLLVGIVLPRFERILADLGQALPPTTRLVLHAAAAARAMALPLAATLVVGLVLWRSWTRTGDGRRRWHDLLLAVPVVGATRLAAATARASAAIAALLESGVPIAPALVHAARASGDAALAARLLASRDAIVHGARVGVALERQRAMTPTAIRLVRAGEESGRLGAMLVHAAKLERARAAQLTASAVRLLEPALIVLFGGLIALVAAALLQAIYAVRPV
jgi:general secretion pathway protein F